MLSACRWQGIWMGCASDSSKWGRRCSCRTRSAGSIQMPSGSEQALEAGGARRLWNESFFSAPQLKRDSLGGSPREDPMVRIDTVVEGNRAAVNDLVAAAQARADSWTTPRAPGKWSPSQLVEHVA